jgi:predicted RNA binding protein YcfA (HicA-like mRNA interferase family)
MCMVCILSMNSREIIKLLEEDGWFKHTQKGSHHCQFKHPIKKAKCSASPKEGLTEKNGRKYLKASRITKEVTYAISNFYS